MELLRLANLQLTLFLMILLGLGLKRWGILDAPGIKSLTALCVDVVIPFNILKSCLAPLGDDVLTTAGKILLAGFLMQLLYLVLNQFLYNRFALQRKKVLQYCTIVSNGGFLGNPVAEGVYGPLGLLYASVYLIPMRIIMWSVGTSYFIAGQHTDRKQVLKKVLTHPCLVAIYLGMLLMVTGWQLPGFLQLTVGYIGNCNAALTMFIIGTILADVPLKSIFNRDSFLFSFLRLGVLPALSWLICRVAGLDALGTGVGVMMTGMPAGATAAIFAAQYHSDAPFATQVVILSTLLSMVTIPLWCYLIG